MDTTTDVEHTPSEAVRLLESLELNAAALLRQIERGEVDPEGLRLQALFFRDVVARLVAATSREAGSTLG